MQHILGSWRSRNCINICFLPWFLVSILIISKNKSKRTTLTQSSLFSFISLQTTLDVLPFSANDRSCSYQIWNGSLWDSFLFLSRIIGIPLNSFFYSHDSSEWTRLLLWAFNSKINTRQTHSVFWWMSRAV